MYAFEICCLILNTTNRLDTVGKIKYEDFRIFTRLSAFCCMRMRVYRKNAHENAILIEKKRFCPSFKCAQPLNSWS